MAELGVDEEEAKREATLRENETRIQEENRKDEEAIFGPRPDPPANAEPPQNFTTPGGAIRLPSNMPGVYRPQGYYGGWASTQIYPLECERTGCNSRKGVARNASTQENLCETCWEDQLARELMKYKVTEQERKQLTKNPILVTEKNKYVDAVHTATRTLRNIAKVIVDYAVGIYPGVYTMHGYHQGQNNVKYMSEGWLELRPDGTIGGSLFSKVIKKECPLYDGKWTCDGHIRFTQEYDGNAGKFGYKLSGIITESRFEGIWKHPHYDGKEEGWGSGRRRSFKYRTGKFIGESFFTVSYDEEKTKAAREKAESSNCSVS